MERSNSDSGYEVECKGFELPIIQDKAKNFIIDLLCDFGAKNYPLHNCHSEGNRPKNPLHILKRFFAKYKFPFAGICVRPAQNDGNHSADFGKSGGNTQYFVILKA